VICPYGLFFLLYFMAASGYALGMGVGAAIAFAYLAPRPKKEVRD
jgi:hypothetical protein